MRCGISTACFYPGETLHALRQLADAGVKVVELFPNTFSELEDEYLQKLKDIVDSAGITVSSLHPFTAAMEGFFFASTYKTRFGDGEKLYRRYFEMCRVFGTDKLVFHGDQDFNVRNVGAAEYARSFEMLAAVGREYGITLCHENIAYCRLNTPDRVEEFKKQLKGEPNFVLDLKQLRRFYGNRDNPRHLAEMLSSMAGSIRQIHVSDYAEGCNCLPPGTGEMDFAAFIKEVRRLGYNGDLIVELYVENYRDVSELVDSMRYLESIL